jgi:hypothetical protein
LAGSSDGERRLQRRFDEQQHGSAVRLWWLNNGDVYLHQYLCATDDHLSGNLHSGHSANRGADLSDQHDNRSLPNAGSSELGLRHLAGSSDGERRLQWRFDEQQHGRTFCLWRLDDRDVYLYQHLCADNYDLPSDLHGGCRTDCGAHLSNERNRTRRFSARHHHQPL